MNRKNVLILDPERDVGDLFARALETCKDCKCYLTSKKEEAIALLKDISFHLLLVDMGMAMAGDFSLLKKVRRLSPDMIILVEAYLHQKEQVSKALEYGARGYIIKPITVDEFRKKIDEFYVWAEA
ncbi:MAG: response regulator [Deltaproteobacteria bacterium]|nr:response regulator [Deltaproteobacteria bacterium]